MKKLMMVAAVALAAAFANAASIDWKFSTSKDYAGYNVYICSELAKGGFTDVADIQSHLLGVDGNKGTISGTRTALASGSVGGLTDAPGTMVDFYYVIVGTDATAGYWTLASTAEAYTTATSYQKSEIAAATANAILGGAATKWASAVPEPTRGLLLLLCMAGLALKRKVA